MKYNNPFFSVIIPIYKVEKYLETCLDSVCNQTFDDYEIILIDDGSPDRCPQICDQYSKKYDNVKVIHKKNEGLVKARKTGVQEAKGSYIVFVDSDDWIELDMLEAYHVYLKGKTIDIVVLDYFQNYDGSEKKCCNRIEPGYYSKDKICLEIRPKMMCNGTFFEFGVVPSVWSKIFKKDTLKKIIKEVDDRITMGEDAAITYPFILEAQNMLVLRKAFYHYRILENSMSNGFDINFFKQTELLIRWFKRQQFQGLEQQLVLYELFLLRTGVERILSNELSVTGVINTIQLICNQDYYKDVLNKIEIKQIKGKEKRYILALKQENYDFYRCIWIGRYLKKKIKSMLVVIKKVVLELNYRRR